MLRFAAAALGCLLTVPALADPPPAGWTGIIGYPDGRVPERFGCDTIDQVRTIYETGKDNIFLMRPKFDEVAREKNENGEAVCLVGRWGPVNVLGSKLLGPVDNPTGDAKLFIWAIHAEGAGGPFWMMYIDVKRNAKDGTI